jgi:hypothetical protein
MGFCADMSRYAAMGDEHGQAARMQVPGQRIDQ